MKKPLKGKPDSSAKKGRRKPTPGMPRQSSIVSKETFLSPKGNQYQIIHTNQKDSYDPDKPE